MATTAQQQIRVKSYFATSVSDAIELARKELGPDALLLNSRQSPPEASHLGPLEVVFGDNAEARRHGPESPAPSAAGIDDLRRKVDEIRNLLVRTAVGTSHGEARRRPVEQVLLDAGLTHALAAEIDEAVANRIYRRSVMDISRIRSKQDIDADLVIEETIEEMNNRIQVKNGLGRITALVGPPGSGKTTTLVKLAIREGLMKGRPVRLISADAQRIAASEQLRIYAGIMGVPFQGAESSAALAQAIDSAPANTLLLIDTPGLSPALLDGPAADLGGFFHQRQDIDVHLVLTASLRQSDMESATARFAIFRPSALIFTRLDETDSLGPIFCEGIRAHLPVSYFCDGQLVPEDIEHASRERLTEFLVRRLRGVLRSAA